MAKQSQLRYWWLFILKIAKKSAGWLENVRNIKGKDFFRTTLWMERAENILRCLEIIWQDRSVRGSEFWKRGFWKTLWFRWGMPQSEVLLLSWSFWCGKDWKVWRSQFVRGWKIFLPASRLKLMKSFCFWKPALKRRNGGESRKPGKPGFDWWA